MLGGSASGSPLAVGSGAGAVVGAGAGRVGAGARTVPSLSPEGAGAVRTGAGRAALGAVVGWGRGAAVGSGVGVAVGLGVGAARGGIITPARSSAGPAGAGVGAGRGGGRLKVPGFCCAAKGTASASAAQAARTKRAGRRIMAGKGSAAVGERGRGQRDIEVCRSAREPALTP